MKTRTPLDKACYFGDLKTLEELLENLKDSQYSPEELCSSLCTAIKRLNDEDKEENNEKCCELMLKTIKSKKDFDTEQYRDSYGNTPLFYAIYHNNPEIVMELLSTLCLINSNNGPSPIDKVDPEMLRRHFDRCVTETIKGVKGPGINITFNFETLLCPEKHKENPHVDSKVVYEISCRKKLENLLLHPMILCFVAMKWGNSKMYDVIFWSRIFFCFLNIALLSAYVMTNIRPFKYSCLCTQLFYVLYVVFEDILQLKFDHPEKWHLLLRKVILSPNVLLSLASFILDRIHVAFYSYFFVF